MYSRRQRSPKISPKRDLKHTQSRRYPTADIVNIRVKLSNYARSLSMPAHLSTQNKICSMKEFIPHIGRWHAVRQQQMGLHSQPSNQSINQSVDLPLSSTLLSSWCSPHLSTATRISSSLACNKTCTTIFSDALSKLAVLSRHQNGDMRGKATTKAGSQVCI